MATLLQLKCEANSWKEAYTTKSVQIINYIKAKSTLRHIYMIQMYVYNSILAGRLGDCWLAPGRLLAGPWEGCYCWLHWEAAGWPLGRLAGPWEVLKGVLILLNFCCSLLGWVEAQGTGCWFDLRCTSHVVRSWDASWLIILSALNLTRNQYGLPMYKMFDLEYRPVTQL